jgi:hypothetical protein
MVKLATRQDAAHDPLSSNGVTNLSHYRSETPLRNSRSNIRYQHNNLKTKRVYTHQTGNVNRGIRGCDFTSLHRAKNSGVRSQNSELHILYLNLYLNLCALPVRDKDKD